MSPENDNIEENGEHTVREKLAGFGQKIIGEIETIGGILTGDPATRAEGEYNVEVGDLREEIAADLEESHHMNEDQEAEDERQS